MKADRRSSRRHWGTIEGVRNNIRVNAVSPIAHTRMTEDAMADVVKDLDPEKVTPVLVYLGHQECDRTAHLYRVGGSKVSRVFIAVTEGIDDPALTPESTAAAIEQIDDPTGFTIRGGPPQ
jgi:hypothetical protein